MTTIGSATAKLFALNAPARAKRNDMAEYREIATLLNRQAQSRMGIVQGELPGSYKPIFRTESQTLKEDVYETRRTSRVEDVVEDRAITEMRDVYEARDITETRDVTETRNVYETRAVYEEREIRETSVEGNRSLTPYNTLVQAGIDIGADFTVKVGDGPAVTFRFDQVNRLSVTANGTTQRFTFTSAAGSMRSAIVSALDSVAGLSATLTTDGRLDLTTDDAQSLTIADVANGLLDFSGSPLAKLGLTAGTTQSSVTGYEQVQTGTEQVLVGTETVVIGSETVVIGSENVLVGTESVTIGTERFKIGERTIATGAERVKIGTASRVVIGERTLVGLQEKEDEGVAGRTALDRFKEGRLPDGYIEALFSIASEASTDREPGLWNGLLAAYRETDALAERSPGGDPETDRG